jgi:5-methylcytosine-specific restriction enzyme subunit McrC
MIFRPAACEKRCVKGVLSDKSAAPKIYFFEKGANVKSITIKEYGSICAKPGIVGYEYLPEPTFSQLREFILCNKSADTDALELMGLSARKGVGEIITAKNYVGIITMKDGTTIEILPKVYSDNDESVARTRQLLIEMLKTLRDTPYKTLQTGNENIEKMNIFEIFIRMFIDEMFFIVKRGLKCSYETIEEKANFFKGKMKFSQQIRYNFAHKERNCVEYDSFTVNRPENRLLKATLQYLYRYSSSSKNRTDISRLLNSFGEVDASVDYNSDFSKSISDRNMKDYTTALMWSRVFLMGKSFTSFAGSEVAAALLFPMETVFESYIATLLKRALIPKGYSVSAQDRKYHLFDEPDKKFLMKPDIVITRQADGCIFVMDTKWKVLSEGEPNYGISQADMYQMYAYQKKYSSRNVTLLYPKTESVGKDDIEFKSEDGVVVKVRFADLFDANKFSALMYDEVRTAVSE